MPASANAHLRRLWLNIHLWIGLGLALLLVPVSLSGGLLVWHDHLDALLHPARYAVTDGAAQPPSVLMDAARKALGAGFEPIAVRMPESAGWPATVSAREQRRGDGAGGGGRPRLVTVYLDPPTAHVLDKVEFRDSLIGLLHRFHENLTIPEYSGRAIVGWSGVAMMVMALSGIYLWWPRNAGFLRGLQWRRGPTLSLNLHHLLGFWISIPLAIVSATGIYLGFPQQGRELLSSVAPMTPQQRGGFAAPLLQGARLDVDRALELARQSAPGAAPTAIFLPNRQSHAWRVQFRESDRPVTVLVDDGTGAASRVTPLTGDGIAQWIRWIHEGSHSGVLWQIMVFICGLLPSVFALTGFLIWLGKRQSKTSLSGVEPAAQPAE